MDMASASVWSCLQKPPQKIPLLIPALQAQLNLDFIVWSHQQLK